MGEVAVKEIVIVSGKGGTGKTSVAAGLAGFVQNAVFCDCDVEAPNLGLVLDSEAVEIHEFIGSEKARIISSVCQKCGLCAENCRFGAIVEYAVDPWACEGCQVCARICPTDAIEMYPVLSGHWFVSNTANGPLVHGRLKPGHGNSGKLVTVIRQKAREIAKNTARQWIVTDGPPGIGCPTIASLSGASLALLVAEPTSTSLHDLERVLVVCKGLRVRAAVCINKWDISPELTDRIEEECKKWSVIVVARVPYDRAVTEAVVRGMPVTRIGCCPAAVEMRRLWDRVVEFTNRLG